LNGAGSSDALISARIILEADYERPPGCIKAIALLAGPDFPISRILFTGPLAIPSVDPKNRSPTILVHLGCSPVSFLALKSFIPAGGVAVAN
jgi:hypothetical protein